MKEDIITAIIVSILLTIYVIVAQSIHLLLTN